MTAANLCLEAVGFFSFFLCSGILPVNAHAEVNILNLNYITGAVFTKGLSQVLGLSWLYFYTKLKPKTWRRPFVNTAPAL